MLQAELVEKIAASAHLTKPQALAALKAFLKETSKALTRGDKVKLVGFGTFTTAKKKERKGMHPKTGEPIVIAARKVVKFKPAEAMGPAPKKKVNNKNLL